MSRKVVITNWPAGRVDWLDAVNNPEDASAGTRRVPFSSELYVEREEFRAKDWAIDGYGVDGIPSVLTLGEVSPRYDVWYSRILASYRF